MRQASRSWPARCRFHTAISNASIIVFDRWLLFQSAGPDSLCGVSRESPHRCCNECRPALTFRQMSGTIAGRVAVVLAVAMALVSTSCGGDAEFTQEEVDVLVADAVENATTTVPSPTRTTFDDGRSADG